MMIKSDNIMDVYNEYMLQFKDEEIVLGFGNLDAEILLIGEAPGKEEVKLSKPFVGKAGMYLNEFLKQIKVERDDIYITNAIKFRLSKINPISGRVSNRPATKNEIIENRKYLINEINIINPKYIVTLGNVPLKSVTGEFGINIGNVHGELYSANLNGYDYKLFPLYHPASMIYNRNLKETYIEDIEKLGYEISKKE